MPAELTNLDDFNYRKIRRQFVIDILTCSEEGDFLVRNATDSSDMVVSVLWKGEVRHFPPNFDGKNYDFGVRGFPTLLELLNFHYTRGVAIIGSDTKTKVFLKRPKIRDKITFDTSDVERLTKLGEGKFGEVYKVRIKSLNRLAAMKTLRASVPKEVRETFMKEFNMLTTMKYDNIVQCIGVVIDKNPSKILLELTNKGSLDKLLRKMKLTNQGKSRILLDVAKGMQYLHARNVIHRNLAARNILVHCYDDGTIAGKVSGFRLSQKDEKGEGYSLQAPEQLPWNGRRPNVCAI